MKVSMIVAAYNAEKYIKIVEEKSILRRLIKTANEIIELGYSPTEDVEDIMEGAEKKIFDIMQQKNQKKLKKFTTTIFTNKSYQKTNTKHTQKLT